MDTSNGPPARVIALVADLIFAGRIGGTARTAGTNVTILRSAGDAIAGVRAGAGLVLLDLDARAVDVPALIRSLRDDPATRDVRILAFGSHVDTAAIHAARAAGADQILARSAFVRRLPELLAGEGRR